MAIWSALLVARSGGHSSTTFGYIPEGGAGIYCATSEPSLFNTIVAFNRDGEAILCDPEWPCFPTISCCDIFGNEDGDWIGCIADQYGINGNISEDPLFCDPDAGDFHLHCTSPCAPAQQPDCGLIGALGVGCGATATVPTTWGAIKSIFLGPGE